MSRFKILSLVTVLALTVAGCSEGEDVDVATYQLQYSELAKGEAAVSGIVVNGNALFDVVIPETTTIDGVTCKVTAIADSAFKDCAAIKSLVIPNSVTQLKPFAVSLCSNLVELHVGSGITKLGQYALSYNDKLETITFASPLESIGTRAMSGCGSLRSFPFEEGLVKIGEKAFYGNKNLRLVELPSTVTQIEEEAFAFCTNLLKISLNENLKQVDPSAFSYNSNLKEIKCLMTEPFEITQESFYRNDTTAELHVRAASKEAYEKAPFWKNFTIIADL